VTVRVAGLHDAEAIVELINAAFVVERFFIDHDRTNLTEVLGFFKTGIFLLAVGEERTLDGCVYLEPRGERAYLGLLSIHPSRQRSGFGAKLVAAAEKHCSELGCLFIDLRIVNVREGLPTFYGKLGYRETRTSPFPADVETRVPCHFVHMSKALASC
jgi:GNAT superfamily N-acetyltransferase